MMVVEEIAVELELEVVMEEINLHALEVVMEEINLHALEVVVKNRLKNLLVKLGEEIVVGLEEEIEQVQ